MQNTLEIINPSNEQTITTIPCDSQSSILKKYESAKKAQKTWAQKPISERVQIIYRFYDLLEKNRDRLAKTLTQEVGKPLQQSINEINGARNRILFFIENSDRYLHEEVTSESKPDKRLEKIVYEPLGVIVNISAWNYPYLVAMNVIIPALIGGNSVLYKPSEFSALTGIEIAKLLHEAGVPSEVFQEIIGTGAQGSALLDLPIDGVFFTGSVPTGRKILHAIAGRFIPSGFELGGKDPIYICEDVDLKKAVASVADGAFYNAGQSCCSVERIYIAESIYDQFVDCFVQEVKSYKMGDPQEPGVYLGPVTRKAQLEVIEKQVRDAVEKGAKLLTGGKRTTGISGKGYYFEPTVLSNVNHDMLVMREESFGPIIGLQKVSSDEEAITLMNDTTYGLTAGVYTPNRERAEKILEKLNAGTAYWNCCDRVSPHLPWSGRKDSGMGSTLSHLGIRAFVRPKAYHLIG